MIFSKKQKVNLFIEKIANDIDVNKVYNFSEYRNAKVKNARSTTQKQLNIQTELLLNKAINYHNTNELYIFPEIITNEQNKPSFKEIDINFNISHSNDYIVIGTSNKNIGIDIEMINNKHLKVAKKLFDEIDYKKYHNNINKIIKHWTIKEAYIKFFGSTMLKSIKKIKINKNKVNGPLGLLYYKTIKFSNYYLTVTSTNKIKLTIYRDKNNII